MALQNNFIPQTSLVFGVRDFAPQIENLQKSDTQGLQNAFKFGTGLVDFIQSNKQADLIEQGLKDKQALQDQLLTDTKKLEELKKELAILQGGV